MLRDVRYGLRTLRNNPAFTLVAVFTLALGIGANTAIFSLINALVLQPLPYKDPSRLMALDLTSGKSLFPWSYPMFEELRRDHRTFENVAGFWRSELNLTGTGAPERIACELVSASYFPLLGIDARFGRVFRPEEDRDSDAHPLVLVGYNLWHQKFGGDPGIIGSAIHLNQFPYTVVGVLPPGFKGQSGDIDAWVPITMAPSLLHMPRRLVNAMNYWLRTIARLNPGVSVAQARDQMEALSTQIARAYPPPGRMSVWRLKATPLGEAKTDPAIRRSLLMLFAAVGFVLLIACVNMANLLMGRAMSRQKEVAVRLAIGASRGALVRQFLTESVILGVLGGCAGFFIAAYGIDLVTALRPEASEGFWAEYARAMSTETIRLDRWVALFNVGISVVAGVLFGLLPALEASRLDLNQALKNITGGWPAGLRNLRRLNSRSALVAGEMALALVLLAGAGLMIESFGRLLGTRIGAASDHILTAHVDLPPAKCAPAAAVQFDEQLLERLKTAPGVQAASICGSLPVRGQTDFTIMDLGAGKEPQGVGVHSVSADYFQLFRIPLRRGRLITDRDRAGSQKVLVVNETAARRLWPSEDPIGKHVLLEVWETGQQEAEIVGVAGDVRYDAVEKPAEYDVYVSFRQYPTAGVVAVRTAGDPMPAESSIRSAVHALDKDLPVYGVKAMDQLMAEATSRTRFSAVLLTVFATLALLLAGIGIYGVVAYSVAARTREIGIRMALGAQARDVRRMVVGDGLLLGAAGIAVGIPGALVAARALVSMLYGTRAADPVAYTAVALLLIGVAALASYIPARRATNVDPVIALKYE